MAGAAVIGALRVVLGADTAALDKGLKDSQSGLASFGSAVGLGMALVAAGVAAAAVSIAASIKSAIGSADQLNKMSQSAGVSVEELSKLKYAADLADVSGEALGKSMGKLAKTLVSAATDAAGPAGRAFAAMGVDVQNQDGTLRSSADVMADLADKFSGYKDGAEKTALAIQIFGKAGAAMIPLLNLGRDGLKEAGDEAQKFGLVLDKKTTIAAEAFNDNLKRMDAIKQGLFTTIAAKLLPAFEMFSEQLLAARSNSDFTTRAADGITTAIKFMVGEVMHASTWIGNLTAELKAFWAVMTAPDWASVKTAWADWETVAENSKRNIENLNVSLRSLWGTKKEGESAGASAADWVMEGLAIKGLNREVMAYGEAWTKAAPLVGEAAAADKNALITFLESQAKRTAGQMAEAETVGKSVGEHAKLKIAYEANAIAVAKNIALTPALIAGIAAAGDEAAAAAIKLQAANLTQDMVLPWDLRNRKLLEYSNLLGVGAISSDTFAAASARIQFPAFTSASIAATDFGMQLDGLATGAVNGLSGALTALVTGTKSAGEAFKAFAVQIIADIAAMIIKMLIFKAIRMVVFGFSDGGMAGGTGFSLTGTGGLFASGGHVSGPGSGTSDSIPAMLSNGEFVVNAQATRQFAPLLNAINSGSLPAFKDGGDVSSNHAGGTQQGGGRTIMMQGMVWGRDQIRDLVAALNEGNRDGIKLEFA